MMESKELCYVKSKICDSFTKQANNSPSKTEADMKQRSALDLISLFSIMVISWPILIVQLSTRTNSLSDHF